ncbi:MAG: hypothetical protein NVS9B4_12580 [Candidatus Acidiferrum sp.]
MKSVIIKLLFAAVTSALCLLAIPFSFGDTLVMRDGTRVTGVLVGRNTNTITFQNSRGNVRRYRASSVRSIEISDSDANNNGYGSPNGDNSGTYNNSDYGNSNSDARPNNGNYGSNSNSGYNGNSRNSRNGSNDRSYNDHQPEVLPAGTRIAVLTNEMIDSKNATESQTFSGQVDQDVVDNTNETIIPRGSPAQLVIRKLSSGGVVGGSEMALDIQSITVHGRRYRVSTEDLKEKGAGGIGANKRTAEMVGGGAVVGTILGALLGHGKGAAIGAAAGAAGGAGVQVLTKGKEVKVPAETVLQFSLDQAVTLAPES